MSTAESVLAQMQELIDKANAKTGRSDTDLTAAVDALIAGYGTGGSDSGGETVCSHENTYEWNFVNSDDTNNHSFEVICSNCGAVVSSNGWGDHVDEDGDGLCDLCGGCIHEMEDKYTANGDGTHSLKSVCSKCGYTENRADAEPCTAWSASYGWKSDGVHTVTRYCKYCHGVVEQYDKNCQDDDGDGYCDQCRGEMPCGHINKSTGWTPNGDGTHTKKTICSDCKEVLSEETVACTDEDNDGLCDECLSVLDTAPWSYAAGELSGLYKYMMYVDADGITLACRSYTSIMYVAVGAVNGDTGTLVSNQTIRAIPIPAAAKKLTFTAGDTYTTIVNAVFIKGTPNAVTSHNENEGVSVTNKVCSIEFEAGAWDYVVFNLRGNWSSEVLASQAATKATLAFE